MELGTVTLVTPIDDSGHLRLVLTPHSNGLMLAELALEQIVQYQATTKMVTWKSLMPALFYSPSTVLLRQTTKALAAGLLSKIVGGSFFAQLSDHLLHDCIFVACPQVLDGALEVVRRPFLWNRSLRVITDAFDDPKTRTALDTILSKHPLEARRKITAALLRDSAFVDAVITAHAGNVLEQFILHQLA